MDATPRSMVAVILNNRSEANSHVLFKDTWRVPCGMKIWAGPYKAEDQVIDCDQCLREAQSWGWRQ